MKMNANRCKTEYGDLVYSLDEKRFIPLEMGKGGPVWKDEERKERFVSPGTDRGAGWRTDVRESLEATGDVLQLLGVGVVRMLPFLARAIVRVLSAFGYLVYWTGYGLIMIVAVLFSAFILPRPGKYRDVRQGCSGDDRPDIDVQVSVKINQK